MKPLRLRVALASAQRQAAYGDDVFLVRNPGDILRGVEVKVEDVPRYEDRLEQITREYSDLYEKLQNERSPGISNPSLGGLGRQLQKLRHEGQKLRAMIERAKQLKSQGFDSGTSSKDYEGESFYIVKNPQVLLRGETIKAADLEKYTREFNKAKKEYEAQAAKAHSSYGKARGLGGHETAALGKVMQKARARLDVARMLQKSEGVKQIRY